MLLEFICQTEYQIILEREKKDGDYHIKCDNSKLKRMREMLDVDSHHNRRKQRSLLFLTFYRNHMEINKILSGEIKWHRLMPSKAFGFPDIYNDFAWKLNLSNVMTSLFDWHWQH